MRYIVYNIVTDIAIFLTNQKMPFVSAKVPFNMNITKKYYWRKDLC